jgi:hypothetical protein
MRARQRHFNPGSAGAVLALDSRFNFNISEINRVDAWIDRSGRGNNATSSSSVRPTLELNQQAGYPSVKFSGLNFMVFTGISAGTDHTSIAVLKLAPNPGSFQFGGVLGGDANNVAPLFVSSNNITSMNVGYTVTTGGAAVVAINASTNPWRVCATNRNGTSVNTFVSSQPETTQTLPANSSANIVNLGRRAAPAALYYNSYVSSVVVFAPRPSASVYARIRHLFAYSFKIPCS